MTDGMFKDTMVNMKWTDIQDSVNKNACAASAVIEEHGPHLCLGTDIYTAHIHCLFIKKKLEEKGLSVVIAPPFFGAFVSQRKALWVLFMSGKTPRKLYLSTPCRHWPNLDSNIFMG